MRDTVVGCDAVLDQAAAALRTTGRVLIEGPAGIGKTSVLRALTDSVAASGTPVLSCAPTETESALPLAALADVLAPLVDDVELLPAPQRMAAQSALLLDGGAGRIDERALASATRTLLDAAAARSPAGVLVAVDDAPWLDPPTERALLFALRRCSADVRVVVTRRTAEHADPRVPLDLDARGPVDRVTLAPLGVGPLHRLLALRFGVSLSRPTVVRLAHESGGNPLLAIEITRAALRLSRMPGPAGDFPVPASMHELVAASLATLHPDSVRAVRLAALLSAPVLADLAAAGVAPGALDAAEEVGLVTVDDAAAVRFTHPVHASAVRASTPAGIRRGLHARLAESCTDPDERARQLARCTVEPDADVATALGDAARRARAHGAPDLAADLYDRAADVSPDAAGATRFRLDSLHCTFDSGNYAQATEKADALARTVHGDPLAETLLLRASIAFSADDQPLARSVGLAALDAATPSSRLAGRIHAHLAVFIDVPVAARDHAENALTLLGDGGTPQDADLGPAGPFGDDRALLASVLLLMFLSEVRTGAPPRTDLLDRALEMEGGTPLWLAGTVPAIWWKGVDQYERARERLETMLDAAQAAGDEPFQHELMQHLVEAETLAGRYERAAAWLESARELAGQLGAGTASERWLGAMLAIPRGELDAARSAAEAGLAEAAVTHDLWVHRTSLQLAATVALAQGRASQAAAAYTELATVMDDAGLVEPLGVRFEPDWVEACVGAGDLDTAEIALHRLATRHELLPRPWTTLALARSMVLLASARGDDTSALVAELTAVRDATAPDVVPFDRARCLQVAGLAHRRARRKLAARDALLAAAAEFEAIGAASFAARARADAARTGTRATAPEDLSSSERRVAELAAAGSTNREIADALFISPKTVEANLARVFRKLSIGRRVELAAALEARAPGSRAGQP